MKWLLIVVLMGTDVDITVFESENECLSAMKSVRAVVQDIEMSCVRVEK